jgi:hypothetical protein
MSKLKELFDKVEATVSHFTLEKTVIDGKPVWACKCGNSEAFLVHGDTPEEAIEKSLKRRQKYVASHTWKEVTPEPDFVEHSKESLFTRPVSD